MLVSRVVDSKGPFPRVPVELGLRLMATQERGTHPKHGVFAQQFRLLHIGRRGQFEQLCTETRKPGVESALVTCWQWRVLNALLATLYGTASCRSRVDTGDPQLVGCTE